LAEKLALYAGQHSGDGESGFVVWVDLTIEDLNAEGVLILRSGEQDGVEVESHVEAAEANSSAERSEALSRKCQVGSPLR